MLELKKALIKLEAVLLEETQSVCPVLFIESPEKLQRTIHAKEECPAVQISKEIRRASANFMEPTYYDHPCHCIESSVWGTLSFLIRVRDFLESTQECLFPPPAKNSETGRLKESLYALSRMGPYLLTRKYRPRKVPWSKEVQEALVVAVEETCRAAEIVYQHPLTSTLGLDATLLPHLDSESIQATTFRAGVLEYTGWAQYASDVQVLYFLKHLPHALFMACDDSAMVFLLPEYVFEAVWGEDVFSLPATNDPALWQSMLTLRADGLESRDAYQTAKALAV